MGNRSPKQRSPSNIEQVSECLCIEPVSTLFFINIFCFWKVDIYYVHSTLHYTLHLHTPHLTHCTLDTPHCTTHYTLHTTLHRKIKSRLLCKLYPITGEGRGQHFLLSWSSAHISQLENQPLNITLWYYTVELLYSSTLK